MIGQLRQAGRRSGVLLWALALLFAVMPALSIAFAAPAGSFTNAIVHSHDHGDVPHSHSHHDHDHADGGTIDDRSASHDGRSGHSDHDRAHVHYDASCPSILVPAPVSLALAQQLSAAAYSAPTRALHGASPSCLLRPPIV